MLLYASHPFPDLHYWRTLLFTPLLSNIDRKMQNKRNTNTHLFPPLDACCSPVLKMYVDLNFPNQTKQTRCLSGWGWGGRVDVVYKMAGTLTERIVLQKTKLNALDQVKNLNVWGSSLDDVSIVNQVCRSFFAFTPNSLTEVFFLLSFCSISHRASAPAS